jgi:hypothetical protein
MTVQSIPADTYFKPLVWEHLGGDHHRAPCPLFGNLRVECYSNKFIVVWSVPGFCDTFVPGEFSSADEAKLAAQKEYERRLLAVLKKTA